MICCTPSGIVGVYFVDIKEVIGQVHGYHGGVCVRVCLNVCPTSWHTVTLLFFYHFGHRTPELGRAPGHIPGGLDVPPPGDPHTVTLSFLDISDVGQLTSTVPCPWARSWGSTLYCVDPQEPPGSTVLHGGTAHFTQV